VDVLRVSGDLPACPTAKQKPETAAATSKAAGSGFYALARLLEHDAEKGVPVFRKTSCSSNNLKRDGDSKKSHHALEASPVAALAILWQANHSGFATIRRQMALASFRNYSMRSRN
jgi:hypothetical protein